MKEAIFFIQFRLWAMLHSLLVVLLGVSLLVIALIKPGTAGWCLYLFCDKTLKRIKPDDPEEVPEMKLKIGTKLVFSKN